MIDIILNSKSKSEACKKLGYHTNGVGSKKIDKILEDNGYDKNYFKNKNKRYCLECGFEIIGKSKRSGNKFCNSSCSATYNNKKRKLDYNKTKDAKCFECDKDIKIKVNSSINNSLCDNCKNNNEPKKLKNCKYCDKKCKNKNSLAQHEIRCKYNPCRIKIKNNLEEYNNSAKKSKRNGKNQWIKAKEEGYNIVCSDETRKKISDSLKGRKYTKERIEKCKITMKETVRKYPESYSSSNVNGRVKKVIYKNITLDSGWELIVAKWLDSKHIKWERPSTGFIYEYNGERLYYPDFYLKDMDLYIEVKGYQRERDVAKWSVVENLVIIKKEEIELIKKDKYKL